MFHFLDPRNLNYLIFEARKVYPESQWNYIRSILPIYAKMWYYNSVTKDINNTEQLNSIFLNDMVINGSFTGDSCTLGDPNFIDTTDPNIAKQKLAKEWMAMDCPYMVCPTQSCDPSGVNARGYSCDAGSAVACSNGGKKCGNETCAMNPCKNGNMKLCRDIRNPPRGDYFNPYPQAYEFRETVDPLTGPIAEQFSNNCQSGTRGLDSSCGQPRLVGAEPYCNISKTAKCYSNPPCVPVPSPIINPAQNYYNLYGCNRDYVNYSLLPNTTLGRNYGLMPRDNPDIDATQFGDLYLSDYLNEQEKNRLGSVLHKSKYKSKKCRAPDIYTEDEVLDARVNRMIRRKFTLPTISNCAPCNMNQIPDISSNANGGKTFCTTQRTERQDLMSCTGSDCDYSYQDYYPADYNYTIMKYCKQ